MSTADSGATARFNWPMGLRPILERKELSLNSAGSVERTCSSRPILPGKDTEAAAGWHHRPRRKCRCADAGSPATASSFPHTNWRACRSGWARAWRRRRSAIPDKDWRLPDAEHCCSQSEAHFADRCRRAACWSGTKSRACCTLQRDPPRPEQVERSVTWLLNNNRLNRSEGRSVRSRLSRA